MRTIVIVIIYLSSLSIKAQNLDSLILKGEEYYHSGEYHKSRNIFEKIHSKYKNDMSPRAFSNFLLTKYKVKEYALTYEESVSYLKANTNKLGVEEANIYHNHALICEAIQFEAEALCFYQKANEIKKHIIRDDKIEVLKPIVEKLNSLIPKVGEEIIERGQLAKQDRDLELISYHPMQKEVEDLILKRIYDLSGEDSGVEIVKILPIRIGAVAEGKLYRFSTRVKCKWWKNDYGFSMYFNEKGQILELSLANQFIEDCVINNDGNYLIGSVSYPRGHHHWSIYTLYEYDIKKKLTNPIFDTFKRLDCYSDSLNASFQSRIFIKDSNFHIEYGFSGIGMYAENNGNIEEIFDSTWLYKDGQINNLKLPKVLKSKFEEMQKLYRNRYSFLGSIEFIEN